MGNQKNGKARVKFYYNRASRKASLTVYEQGALLLLSSSLQRILRVRSHTLVGPRHYAGDFIMDLNEDSKSVYIYSDLVSARPVGDTMAPLLRIVPMSDKKQEVVHYSFAKPHLYPTEPFPVQHYGDIINDRPRQDDLIQQWEYHRDTSLSPQAPRPLLNLQDGVSHPFCGKQ